MGESIYDHINNRLLDYNKRLKNHDENSKEYMAIQWVISELEGMLEFLIPDYGK